MRGTIMHRSKSSWAVLGSAALAVAACQNSAASVDTAAIANSIKADEKKWSDEFQAKPRDLEALVGHYADDADFVAPGVKPASGITEIRKAYSEGLADPNFTISFAADKVEVAEAGDIA